jgi:hypothetical protein
VEVAEAPPWVLELLDRPRPDAITEGKEGHPLKVPERIPVGRRNSTLTSLGGALRRDGYTPDEIEALLLEARRLRCDDVDHSDHPFPEEEAHRIARGLDRYEPEHSIRPIDPDNWLSDACKRSLAEIMAGEKPAQRPAILGDGLLPERSAGSLFGPPNLGKTELAIIMALAVAAGRDLFGWATTASNVLYLCPELDLTEFWERVEAIEAAECSIRGWNPAAPTVLASLERARERIFPVTADMLTRLPDLREPDDCQAIIDACRAREARLLLLDPLALFHSANENSNEEMLGVMRTLHEIKTGADTTPFLIHHNRKGKPGVKDPGFDAMRGAGAIAAHARVILRLEESRGKLCLSCEKATHSRRPDPIWLERLHSGALVRSSPPADRGKDAATRIEAAVEYLQSGPHELTLAELRERVPILQEVGGRTVRNYLKQEASRDNPRVVATGTTSNRRWKRTQP